jgi:hypothetical protein
MAMRIIHRNDCIYGQSVSNILPAKQQFTRSSCISNKTQMKWLSPNMQNNNKIGRPCPWKIFPIAIPHYCTVLYDTQLQFVVTSPTISKKNYNNNYKLSPSFVRNIMKILWIKIVIRTVFIFVSKFWNSRHFLQNYFSRVLTFLYEPHNT